MQHLRDPFEKRFRRNKEMDGNSLCNMLHIIIGRHKKYGTAKPYALTQGAGKIIPRLREAAKVPKNFYTYYTYITNRAIVRVGIFR